ncbi:unnamed protein product [Parnassius apollo]|uniref:(apollo) hypothetical protein n=1 Tax=Parnassius apollo TaxID=110799 RepID=A0A8S3XAH0_PARAO|nr:unnamed protein product [Parnassius apollo]
MVEFLTVAVLLASASTETNQGDAYRYRSKALEGASLSSHCQYEGRWYADGAVVTTREVCLRCQCVRGAISCRRRACAPLPEPPPPQCHTLHRKGVCCPELHCRDGAITMERGASARFETEHPDIASSNGHVCVEGGTAYAAGSAMSSNTACEQCFCLGGARRCVRPKCLPPPDGCRARPAPGVCCPQRYYYCKVEGKWVMEGERIVSGININCSHCFCLRGSVKCQHLACAPPLLGCKPLLAPGQCCPHQYQCDHQHRRGLPGFHLQPIIDNALISIRNQDRSLHNALSYVNETTTLLSTTETDETTITTVNKDLITTTKVKRKTSGPPVSHNTSKKAIENVTTTTVQTTPKTIETTERTTTLVTEATTEISYEDETTEQPDGTVKIMINGTINCTAELSSTTITLNSTENNDTEKYVEMSDFQPRIPNIMPTLENHTYNPNDIITERNYNEDFDDNESFTIKVTSSLNSSIRTNPTLSTTVTSTTMSVSTEMNDALNISKKTMEDYDYNNYNKPTLPPSLPNLKIIPFVAADAVVDDDISSKESFTYPSREKQDKYPVYYSSVGTKEIPYATRREDFYNPTQFPIFLSKKVEPHQYPLSVHEVDLTNEYPSITSDIVTALHEYTVQGSASSNVPQGNKAVTKVPNPITKFELETPAVNLFSPPMETEGGFIPKGPSIINDYYGVYPSTPANSIIPHLTTSMQLDTVKGDCVSGDGRRVLEGESIYLACSVCTCAWGDLHCSQRPCHIPPGCKRRPSSSSSIDLCCGDLICNEGNKTTPAPIYISTRSVQDTLNKTEIPSANMTELLTEVPLSENATTISHVITTTSQPNIAHSYSSTLINRTVPAEKTEMKLETNSIEKNTASTPTKIINDLDAHSNNSQEYEDEDDDDEGFSFGSVLKLLLSDSYETTTISAVQSTPVTKLPVPMPINSTPRPSTNRQPAIAATPATHHASYTPPKIQQPHNTINRIDHLVLGEATAIRKTTPRPVAVPFKPLVTRKPPPFRRPVTQIPTVASKPVEVTKKSEIGQYTSVPQESHIPTSFNSLGGLGPGLLKLAGCNIYGQMYRVGRIITELSTPCQECRCTEIGVQCRPLSC